MLQHSLSALIVSFPVSIRLKTANNILVNSTLHIWSQFCKHIGARTRLLCKNPIFPPSMQDKTFELWFRNDMRTVQNLLVESVLASFQQLAERFHIPNFYLFRYLQLRAFYRKMYQDFPTLQQKHQLI